MKKGGTIVSKATDKQLKYIDRIMKHVKPKDVRQYVTHFYLDADMNNLTKEQAQKIITGLQSKIPGKPIKTHISMYYTYGRD